MPSRTTAAGSASAGQDQAIILWDRSRAGENRILEGPGGPVPTAWPSADSQQLASADLEEIILWDVATGRKTGTMRGHAAAVPGLAYSPSGRQLASASLDQTVKLWDTAGGQEVRTFKGHAAPCGDRGL